jgi:hypothetical protein
MTDNFRLHTSTGQQRFSKRIFSGQFHEFIADFRRIATKFPAVAAAKTRDRGRRRGDKSVGDAADFAG